MIVGDELAIEILKALGIDTKDVCAVTISLRARDVATITVDRYMPSMKDSTKLVKLFEKYELRPKGVGVNNGG